MNMLRLRLSDNRKFVNVFQFTFFFECVDSIKIVLIPMGPSFMSIKFIAIFKSTAAYRTFMFFLLFT